MKLIYRGATYNYDPTKVKARRPFPHPDELAYKLIYRGSTYRFDPTIAKLAGIKPRTYELIYRGTTYQVHQTATGKTTSIILATSFFKPKALITHSTVSKTADKHP
jgi:Domain of unknown function (DUF4278)